MVSEKRTPSARERFAANLRTHRLSLRMSQEELAEKSGLHRTYVGSVERSERNVSVDNMELLAQAVNTPLWMLLKE